MSSFTSEIVLAVFGTANNVNKFAHGVVLLFFGVACWLVSVLLRLPAMLRLRGAALELPAFTKFCVAIGPALLIGLAALATLYCLWVWLRKAETLRSWVGFLAIATFALFLVTLPVVIALYLPLVAALQHVTTL